ncbi:NADPH-dependent FMN reductase [Rufibacter quisquiliarum]|uniref:NAD(P)H-dependent FMN reductase n=1 Tax=Rufibacter quisquiliarum TaxID=1549639 RepID=A0A839GFS9_9BACT|nr:NAD(P)H-dependent oxidoreductase [Rufibacter quisquiliarum]MBA9076423.1 NAD(P)H-dependent FMN reductase [Rufibacter quisquiliarum]
MILLISGTNRPNSLTLQITKLYQQLLEARNEASEILDLQDLPLDFASPALYKKEMYSQAFLDLRARVAAVQKIVFVVPEYNCSFPGVLKAFIDGLEYPVALRNKKGALVGLSTGSQGGNIALSHLTDVLHYCGLHVLAQKPRLPFIHKHLAEGNLTYPLYQQLLEEQIEALLTF